MAAPQLADHGLVLEEPEPDADLRGVAGPRPEDLGADPEERTPFWLVCARRREKLRRGAPPTVAARLPRVERVELREIHGELTRVSICTPASAENPIDLNRKSSRGPRNWLTGVDGQSVFDASELRELGFYLPG